MYVGSYGRGTAATASDLDVLLSLPRDEYERYDGYRGNGQSRLLQAVKDVVLATYPNSNIKGDGQVVVVDFSDGMKFELLPAFERVNGWGEPSGYDYPDTHMGGHWLSTHPKDEQTAMRERSKGSNGLLFDTCKHIRNLHAERYSSYKLFGIVGVFFGQAAAGAIVASCLSVVTLGLSIYSRGARLPEKAEEYARCADRLWVLLQDYISLLVDFDDLDVDVIRARRDSP